MKGRIDYNLNTEETINFTPITHTKEREREREREDMALLEIFKLYIAILSLSKDRNQIQLKQIMKTSASK